MQILHVRPFYISESLLYVQDPDLHILVNSPSWSQHNKLIYQDIFPDISAQRTDATIRTYQHFPITMDCRPDDYSNKCTHSAKFTMCCICVGIFSVIILLLYHLITKITHRKMRNSTVTTF